MFTIKKSRKKSLILSENLSRTLLHLQTKGRSNVQDSILSSYQSINTPPSSPDISIYPQTLEQTSFSIFNSNAQRDLTPTFSSSMTSNTLFPGETSALSDLYDLSDLIQLPNEFPLDLISNTELDLPAASDAMEIFKPPTPHSPNLIPDSPNFLTRHSPNLIPDSPNFLTPHSPNLIIPDTPNLIVPDSPNLIFPDSPNFLSGSYYDSFLPSWPEDLQNLIADPSLAGNDVENYEQKYQPVTFTKL